MRLNLGCGSKYVAGYIDVDQSGTPDIVQNLESFPWPWPDNSAAEVKLIHVLEHLGRDTDTFKKIIQELYRICRDNAMIHVVVPHPKHDSYLDDPTHIRPITEGTIHLLSRNKNLEYRRNGVSNSCLGLDERWKSRLQSGQITADEMREAALDHWNVIEMLEMNVRVVKSYR